MGLMGPMGSMELTGRTGRMGRTDVSSNVLNIATLQQDAKKYKYYA